MGAGKGGPYGSFLFVGINGMLTVSTKTSIEREVIIMKFNWNKYDAQFLEELVFASDLSDMDKKKATFAVDDHDVDMLANIMNNICTIPDREFVMKYRRIIEQSLLLRYPDQVKDICKVIGITSDTYNEKQKKMCEKATTSTLIRAYITAMMNINGMSIPMNEYSKFQHTIPIDMKATSATNISLYDFQEDAVEKLKNYFVTQNMRNGMLVMPTGSGKTRTSTYFLIKEMVSKGYQILWICHRHMLIDQAADAFYNFAGLAKLTNPDIKKYRISCISGVHQRISAVGKDEIIVASIASICRNKDHLKRILGQKVMIVIDESHHALAPSYDDVIRFVKKCKKNVKLLGITATPIRANEKDSKLLMRQFDDTVVYSIDMSTLIKKGILADPYFTRIGTGESFEQSISDAEAQAIRRRGELPETLASRMASSKTRNKVITDEYMNNREKYGKTLIFALDVLHCRLLYEDFKKLGVKVGHIYSGKEDNQKVIQDFKDNKYDVLINVNIMTEGTDVPDIQTVFLTRPTQSEGLLLQMIGRGMRGEKADKGTKTVNIVDFHDQWSVFNKWLVPEWIIGPINDDAKHSLTEYKKREYVEYEWKDCMDLYNQIMVETQEYGKLIATPVGWYTLVDEEGELHTMLVFEDQLQGLLALRKDFALWKENLEFSYNQVIEKYFSYMCNEPCERDIILFLDNMRTMEIKPQMKVLENRKAIDPY